MDCLVAVTVTHHAHEANSQVVVVGDMPGSACPPEPVGVISVGTVCLVQEAVVASIGSFRYAATFHLAVPVVEAGVSEAFRNQGIGKEGLLMFEQLAAENGYEKLSMICADSNPAIYLYERLGYQKEKMLSTWYTTRDKKRDLYEQENKQ